MSWHLVRQPLLRHSSTGLESLSSLPLMRSSQGTVSSKTITCLEATQRRTMSGLNRVFATASGNLSCFPRSTPSSQSCGVANRPEEMLQESAADVSPALVNAMVFFTEGSCYGRWYGMDGIHYGLQDLVVWPAVAPFMQLRMCSKVPLLWQRRGLKLVSPPHPGWRGWMDSAAHGRPPGSRMTSVYRCCWSGRRRLKCDH